MISTHRYRAGPSEPGGLQITSTVIPLGFLGFCEPLLRLLSQLLEIKRLRLAAGFALIPKMPEAFDVFLTKLTFELPVANGFADDFACGCIFSGFNRGLQDRELLSGQGNTDFRMSGMIHLEPQR